MMRNTNTRSGSPRSAPTRGAAGFTAVEATIAVVILGVVLAVVAAATQGISGAYSRGAARQDHETRAHRLLDSIARELSSADAATLALTPLPVAADTLAYRHGVDYVAGVPVWGNTHRFELQLSPSELDDGIDNDGNGVVDDCRLVRVRDAGLPTESSVVVGRWVRELQEGELDNGIDDNGNGLVDEPGCLFSVDDDVVSIQLCLERPGPDGRPQITTVTTSVKIRN